MSGSLLGAMDTGNMLRGPALEELPAQSSADPVSTLSNLRIAGVKEKTDVPKEHQEGGED